MEETNGNDFDLKDKTPDDAPKLTESLRDVASSFRQMIQAEIRLAKAEFQDGLENVSAHFTRMAIFGGITVLGFFSFLAFLVIGLGRILGDNYWLSSLVLSILFSGIGALFARRAWRAIRLEGLSLPKTRSTLEAEMNTVADSLGKNVVSIQSNFKRRTS